VGHETLAVIKPDSYHHIHEIVEIIESVDGLKIEKMRLCKLPYSEAEGFYAEHNGKPFFKELISFMCEDAIVVIVLRGLDAVDKWRSLIGPTDSALAKNENPNCIRARFGTDATRNSVHGSDSSASAEREINFFFPSDSPRNPLKTVVFSHCSLLIIKPHIVYSSIGKVFRILAEKEYEISAIETLSLSQHQCKELLRLYPSSMPVYEWSLELQSGTCIAVQVRKENVVAELRELVGPIDPVKARISKPNCLRALFGVDIVKNGFYCTDLDTDGIDDCKLIFN
jgi:nucleoside-diphosphate kinase